MKLSFVSDKIVYHTKISYLGMIGGTNVKETVWRLLSKTINNILAQQMNWTGVNGKRAFKNLTLKDVFGAVRRNSLTSKVTDEEIEVIVKRWFQLAGDRAGGRRAREN
ncbi:hypothetical protein AOXY_G2603 [Acipenser oxyrinchus oxyrinchus]|uniref:DUF4806 domain-containing protein n=1 Tax=Acipenser oxyrinchus oxyrinchus TaxID=40147 RepID=A0AAD8GJ16_ACIOX|nr:hypothetical protein AOXY_G2603 [Acipenser oxyrinchus oxyrinchus]